jgi:hypothetical protein
MSITQPTRPERPMTLHTDTRPSSRRTERISPSAAAVMRPVLVVLPILLFLVPGILLGLTRTPTYTSDARLLLAGFDVQSAALPGFVEASRTLADTYARLVDTDAVVQPVAKALSLPRTDVVGHISASSIADSAIIRIEGRASSKEDAARFASAAATALSSYVRDLGGQGDQLQAEYRAAVKTFADATARKEALDGAYAVTPSAANRNARSEATADYELAKANADRAANRYNGAGGGGASLALVGPPNTASSDRLSTLELLIAAPLLLGSIVGLALATIVVNRDASAANTPQ